MRRVSRTAMLLAMLLAAPVVAHAGWMSDWTNTLVKQNGDHTDSQQATMAIDGGRVRMQQPDVVTVIDYNTGRVTMMNPAKHTYWSGTVDDYVRDVTQNRALGLRQQFATTSIKNKHGRAAAPAEYKAPTVDLTKLPPVSLTKSEGAERIAGYDVVKYEARADGVLFQEFWVAPTLNLSRDLDPARFLAIQQKMGVGMVGKSAAQHNALYRDDEYRKLLESGFVLKIVNHHIGGEFEHVATAMRQTDVPADQFEVPTTYRRVSLADLLPAPAPGG